MQFIYPARYHWLWEMLAESTKLNYYVGENVIVLMGVQLYEDVTKYRETFPNHKIILYQLEPLSEYNAWWSIDKLTSQLHKVDEVWDYEINNINYLRTEHNIHAVYRPFLYSENCCKYVTLGGKKDIDVLFYGHYTDYRSKYLDIVNKKFNGSTMWLSHIHHPLLDEFISRSKFVLNVHHSENLIQQEQARIFYLLANGKEVLSTRSKCNIYGNLITETDSPYEMGEILNEKLVNYDSDKEYYTKYLFKKLKYEEVFERTINIFNNQ